MQLTTDKNEALIFDINNKKPALIKHIKNTQDFGDPQKYVEPGFMVTTDCNLFRRGRVEKCLVPNIQGSIIMQKQQSYFVKDSRFMSVTGMVKTYAPIDKYEVDFITEEFKEH